MVHEWVLLGWMPLCWVSRILSVANKPYKLSVVMLNVVMLIVVPQSTKLDCFKPDSLRFFAFWNRLPTDKVHEVSNHLVHWELDCQKK